MFIVCWLTAQTHSKIAGNRFHRSRRHHRRRRRRGFFSPYILAALDSLDNGTFISYAHGTDTIKATFRNSYFLFSFFFFAFPFTILWDLCTARLGANVRLLQCRPIFLIL